MRAVMNDTERIHEIVRLDRNERGQPFGVHSAKVDAVSKPKHICAPARQFDGSFRKIDSRDAGPCARETDSVGADPAADLENAFAFPSREIGKCRNVRLDKILALLDLVEICAAPDRSR